MPNGFSWSFEGDVTLRQEGSGTSQTVMGESLRLAAFFDWAVSRRVRAFRSSFSEVNSSFLPWGSSDPLSGGSRATNGTSGRPRFRA